VAEEKDNPNTEKPPEAAKVPPPAPPKPATPPPPPKPPAAAGAHPPPPKPKGPAQEPWTAPIVDALKEEFGGEILKSYSFIGQNQIDVKKTRIAEIMTFLRDNSVVPFDYLADETAVH